MYIKFEINDCWIFYQNYLNLNYNNNWNKNIVWLITFTSIGHAYGNKMWMPHYTESMCCTPPSIIINVEQLMAMQIIQTNTSTEQPFITGHYQGDLSRTHPVFLKTYYWLLQIYMFGRKISLTLYKHNLARHQHPPSPQAIPVSNKFTL